MTWGDNGAARPVTEEYSNGYDRIFQRNKETISSEQEESIQLKTMAPEWSWQYSIYKHTLQRIKQWFMVRFPSEVI